MTVKNVFKIISMPKIAGGKCFCMSLFSEHGIPAKMKQMFSFCNAFDIRVL